MKRIIALALGATLVLSAAAQSRPTPVKPESYTFTVVKENPITSIKNQNRSGTCWCFSMLSFLESEAIKAKGIKDESLYPDFSEMYVVRKAYYDRALKFVRLDGKLNFAAGSDFGDVLEVAKAYGLIDQKAYSGLQYGYDLPVQSELDAVLKGYVDAVVKNPNRKLTKVWPQGLEGILDAYMGQVPETFVVNGVTYTPETYRDAQGLNLDDYIGFTSYTHHPFYTQFAMEVADNWRWTPSWNVPLDEFMAIMDYAVKEGYTVAWGGDVSEAGFTRNGLGILIDTAASTSGSDQERWVGKADEKPTAEAPAKEIRVTQELRQEMYDEKTSTDDHGMHLYGIAKDQNGTKYYMIKNSWGETGAYKGIWYMSEEFAKGKTLNIVVNKKAVPKEILKKIGIK
ncbi:MAG: aminopeptidase [Bacteroidales bacterium]|nr:aminopeptidase [Bacteroidales bacterium]MBR1781919.1 aminopeptidase [Bacteroidales bacterium]